MHRRSFVAIQLFKDFSVLTKTARCNRFSILSQLFTMPSAPPQFVYTLAGASARAPVFNEVHLGGEANLNEVQVMSPTL